MKCPKCQYENDIKNKYCTNCGNKLPSESEYSQKYGLNINKIKNKTNFNTFNNNKVFKKLKSKFNKKLIIVLIVIVLIAAVGFMIYNTYFITSIEVGGVTYNVPEGFSRSSGPEIEDRDVEYFSNSDNQNISLQTSTKHKIINDVRDFMFEGYVPKEVNGIKGFYKVITSDNGDECHYFGFIRNNKMSIITAPNEELFSQIVTGEPNELPNDYEPQSGDVMLGNTVFSVQGTVLYVLGWWNEPLSCPYWTATVVDENGDITVFECYKHERNTYDKMYLGNYGLYQLSHLYTKKPKEPTTNQFLTTNEGNPYYTVVGEYDSSNSVYHTIKIVYSTNPDHMTTDYLNSVLTVHK